MNLIRDLALFEAMGVAVEGVDTFSSLILYRHRIHRLQYIEVVGNRWLLEPQALRKFPYRLAFFRFPQKTHELVPTLHTHHLKAVWAELLLAHDCFFHPRWTGERSCFRMSVFW